MKYTINKSDLQYSADGKTFRGDDRVLLNSAIDLTSKTEWTKNGFTIENLFNESDFQIFKTNTKSLLLKCWRDAGLSLSEDFSLDQILAMIQNLPNQYRLVFNLYEMDNYSHTEIADMLSISIGTSKSNLHRAKMILKEQIKVTTSVHNMKVKYGK